MAKPLAFTRYNPQAVQTARPGTYLYKQFRDKQLTETLHRMKPILYKEKLLWLRLQQGWSQEEAAFHCGASDKKQYHLWETGKTRLPRAAQLAAIAGGFKLKNADDILIRPGDAPDPAFSKRGRRRVGEHGVPTVRYRPPVFGS